MFDKKEELNRINFWVDKLNVCNPGWENGDLEKNGTKTADLINHKIKYAIELKREKGDDIHKANLDTEEKNLSTLSNRLESYFKKTNRKFKNYLEYKTLLIIELHTYIGTAHNAMQGITRLHFSNNVFTGASKVNKKLFTEMENIGGIVFGQLIKVVCKTRQCILIILMPNPCVELPNPKSRVLLVRI
jgi:hypothetical protein